MPRHCKEQGYPVLLGVSAAGGGDGVPQTIALTQTQRACAELTEPGLRQRPPPAPVPAANIEHGVINATWHVSVPPLAKKAPREPPPQACTPAGPVLRQMGSRQCAEAALASALCLPARGAGEGITGPRFPQPSERCLRQSHQRKAALAEHFVLLKDILFFVTESLARLGEAQQEQPAFACRFGLQDCYSGRRIAYEIRTGKVAQVCTCVSREWDSALVSGLEGGSSFNQGENAKIARTTVITVLIFFLLSSSCCPLAVAQVQQDLPARTNISAPTSPALTRDALHTKMEQLEEQLLSKILTLQKERQAANSDHSQQQHDIEKELNSLQNRVAELEHGPPTFSPPDAFKVTIPVQNNYMYARMKKTLPELYAFTICMWLKSKASGGLGTPFSYSVPGQANEIVLLEWGTNPLELLINDKVAQLPLSLKDKAWHHICVAWTTRDGKWAAYQDGTQRGASENLASWHAIKPQGVIILGQEQDTLGGRFDATQAFVGEIAQFGIWDHMLAPADIQAMANCTSRLQGNVIQWDDQAVEVFGGAGKASFTACEERMKA
ncbi:PREDICTED: neuronal pentraxin receptor [Tinamus guttatus]|uniref:neuronal pentraxin receptor n=1 Tax=Tinamus guttatus TaxID=94827 RepID=UPI00052EFE55|nr:PREDICTED: neuronal pentraxin receptor [Tinamus guttatus]